MNRFMKQFVWLLMAVFCLFGCVSCVSVQNGGANSDGDDTGKPNNPPKEITLAASTLAFPEGGAFAASFPSDGVTLGGIKCALPSSSDAYLNGLISDRLQIELGARAPQGSTPKALDMTACYRDEDLYSFAFLAYYDCADSSRVTDAFYLSVSFSEAKILKLSDLVKTSYFPNPAGEYLATYLNAEYAGKYDTAKASAYVLSPDLIDSFYVSPGGVTLVFDERTLAVSGQTLLVYFGNAALVQYKRNDTISTQGPESSYPDDYEPAKPGEKVVAMTFDDGPGGESTARLLDYLEANHIKATFFVNGYNTSNLETNEYAKKLVVRAASLGCEIGNHSYSHAYFNKITAEQRSYQIVHNTELIEAACGITPTLFRAGGGIFHDGMAEASDYFYIDWSVDGSPDNEDWRRKHDTDGGEAVANAYLSDIGPGSIVLMHDVYENSVSAAIRIMNALKAQGYRFVTVSELLDLKDKTPDGTIYCSQTQTRKYNSYEK